MIRREWETLQDVLNSGAWGTIAPQSLKAGRRLADLRGRRYGIMLFSASAALEAVLRGLEIGCGDEVILASCAHPASAMAALCVQAAPVFADIDFQTGTLSPASAAARVTSRTRAVIADQFAGNPCDMAALSALCQERGLNLIENAGDGYRTTFLGEPSCALACACALNLGYGRAIDTGGGGALLCDDERIFQAAFAYHNCGRQFGAGVTFAFDEILGGDLRVSEWPAALVETRADALDRVIAARKAKAEKIYQELSGGLIPIKIIGGGTSSYSFAAFACPEDLPAETLIGQLRARGFAARRGYRAMHRQPVFASEYFKKQTGRADGYADDGLQNSIRAQERYLFIDLKEESL